MVLPAKKPIICANTESCVKDLTAKVENNSIGYVDQQVITPPAIDLSLAQTPSNVLGDSTVTGEKHIYVDLAKQTLYAYQGNTLFMQTLISSGKWHPTPTGDYKIWIKLRSTRMSGGEGDDYYNLPNVPYVMFFYNAEVPKSAGYSLHGAYWHNNFGHPMSHGCINMREVDVAKLYNWASPQTEGNTTLATADNDGTPVTIYGQAPL